MLASAGGGQKRNETEGQRAEKEKLLCVLKYVLRDLDFEKEMKMDGMPADVFEDFIELIAPKVLSNK